jgi:hypothetical protein
LALLVPSPDFHGGDRVWEIVQSPRVIDLTDDSFETELQNKCKQWSSKNF